MSVCLSHGGQKSGGRTYSPAGRLAKQIAQLELFVGPAIWIFRAELFRTFFYVRVLRSISNPQHLFSSVCPSVKSSPVILLFRLIKLQLPSSSPSKLVIAAREGRYTPAVFQFERSNSGEDDAIVRKRSCCHECTYCTFYSKAPPDKLLLL